MFSTAQWRSVAVVLFAATLVLGFASSGAAGPTGLVAAYSFDAGSGSVLADVSGTGNNGTISGAAWTTAGHSGSALSFNGVSNKVAVPNAASLNLTSGMTIEAWVRPSAAGNWRTIAFKERPGGVAYSLYSDQSGSRPVGQVYLSQERNATGTSSVPLNSWTHLATTYDGTTLRLYKNGVLAGSTAVSGAMLASTGPLDIGGNSIWSEWFQGQIDDLRIYNRALAPSELQTDMNTPVGAPPVADTQAPSTPGGLAVSGQTQTGLTLSWSASTDNVATTGYTSYRNGTAAGSTAAATRTYAFSGLACGTTYTLGVDAVDAAGNRSTQANTNGITTACATGNGSSNLWVDANGGACVRSATAIAYSDANACTWDAANDTCVNGDAVGVKGGSYGSVTLSGSNGRTAACTFAVAAGETATMTHFNDGEIGGGDTGADWITVIGPVVASEFDADGTAHVTLDNWNVNGNLAVATQPFHVEGSTSFTVKNSKIHGVKNANAMIYLSGSGYTFDNNDIYDSLDTTDGAIHTECIYATSVSSFTLTRNHFWSCATEDVFITGSELATNWRVENNIFEHPLGPNANALAFRSGGSPSPSPDGFVLRYNTFGRDAGIQINSSDNPVTANGFTVVGNFFSTQAPCGMSNTTYDYNVFVTGDQCGTHAGQGSLAALLGGFTDAHNAMGNGGGTPEAPGNYTTVAGSALRDTGGPSGFPALDRDGKARFTGAAPDVGAYENG